MQYGLPWSEDFIHELEDKETRDEYVADHIRARIALLIRTLREQGDRKWSQAQLAQKMGTKQSVISRLEDPDYGKCSLQTLLDAAAAFDLPLWVDMPEWEDWLRKSKEIRRSQLVRESFDAQKLVAQAKAARDGIDSGTILRFEVSHSKNTGTSTESSRDAGPKLQTATS